MNDFTKQAYFARVLENTFQKDASSLLSSALQFGKGMLRGGLKDFGRAGRVMFGANTNGRSAAFNMLKGLGTAARGVGRMAVPIAGAGLAGYGALKAMQFAGKGAPMIENGVSNLFSKKDNNTTTSSSSTSNSNDEVDSWF